MQKWIFLFILLGLRDQPRWHVAPRLFKVWTQMLVCNNKQWSAAPGIKSVDLTPWQPRAGWILLSHLSCNIFRLHNESWRFSWSAALLRHKHARMHPHTHTHTHTHSCITWSFDLPRGDLNFHCLLHWGIGGDWLKWWREKTTKRYNETKIDSTELQTGYENNT